MRDRYVVSVLLIVLALVAGACSSDEPEVNGDPVAAASASPEVPPVCPLTGEESAPDVVARPAVAVKVENDPAARPQAGLEAADVVFEEIVEGGITRFMAIYHCGETTKAGPVRSARFDDPKIAKPITTFLAFSGGNAIVEDELAAQGMVTVDEDTAGAALYRVPEGVLTVHNLFADAKKLRKIARKQKVAPPSEVPFTFGDLPAGAKKAASITLNFLASNVIEYRWSGEEWQRFEAGAAFMTEAGEQLAFDNVIVQQVDVNNSRTIVDVAGNPSPDISLTGSGKALLFRDGKVIKGTWSTAEEGTVTTFETKSGDAFVLKSGNTIVELVPSPNGEVKGSFSFSKK